MSDAELVALAARGSRVAVEEIHRRYAPFVHAILLARLPFSECEDATQEVFVRAIQGIGRLQDGEKLAQWLAAIARNVAAGFFRKGGQKLVSIEDAPETAGPAARPEGRRILEEIRKLPEAYRETMVLRFVEGMTGPEIAERTGLTHGSVRVNLSRGVQMLRERLGSLKERT